MEGRRLAIKPHPPSPSPPRERVLIFAPSNSEKEIGRLAWGPGGLIAAVAAVGAAGVLKAGTARG